MTNLSEGLYFMAVEHYGLSDEEASLLQDVAENSIRLKKAIVRQARERAIYRAALERIADESMDPDVSLLAFETLKIGDKNE